MELLARSLYSAPRLLGLSCSTCAQHVSQASTTSPSSQQVQPGPPEVQAKKVNRRTELDFEELVALQTTGDIALIDVRHPQELEKADAIPGAVSIPLCHLKLALQLSDEEWSREFQVEKPDKGDRNLVFYARGPNASSAAVEIAHRLGFKRSRHYTGGWEDYCRRTGQSLTKAQQEAFDNCSNYYQSQFDQYFL